VILCAHSNENHSSPCIASAIRVLASAEMGMGGNRDYFFRNKWELEYSLRVPKAGDGNGNEVMGTGGNGYTKVIPTHLYL